MARVFTCGCEVGHYGVFNDYSFSADLIDSVHPRTGTYCLKTQYFNSIWHHAGWALVDPAIELYIRFYIRGDSGGDSDQAVFAIYDDVGHKHIYIDFVGNLYQWDGAVWNLLDTASAVIPQDDTYHLVEAYVKISQSPIYPDGEFILKLDGVAILTVTNGMILGEAFGTDFTAGIVQLGDAPHVGGTTGITYYDDIAINDTTGTRNNSWIGAGAIIALRPDAVGDYSEFTPTPGAGESNYADVDESPPDEDTSYVEATSLAVQDLYYLEDLGDAGYTDLSAINCVCLHSRVKLPAAGSGSLTFMYKYKAIMLVDLSTIALASSDYAYFQENLDEDPVTGGPWVCSDIDQSQFGYREGV